MTLNSDIDLEHFSLDLLVEFTLDTIKLQYTPSRPYLSNFNGTDESLKRYVKITETLIKCIKLDQEKGTRHTEETSRKEIAKMLCFWNNDLDVLYNIYVKCFKEKYEERLQKEIDSLSMVIISLRELIHQLKKKLHFLKENEFNIDRKDEIVFVNL